VEHPKAPSLLTSMAQVQALEVARWDKQVSTVSEIFRNIRRQELLEALAPSTLLAVAVVTTITSSETP